MEALLTTYFLVSTVIIYIVAFYYIFFKSTGIGLILIMLWFLLHITYDNLNKNKTNSDVFVCEKERGALYEYYG